MASASTSTMFDIEINFRALILAVIVGVSCSLLIKRSSGSGSDVTGWCHLQFTCLSTFFKRSLPNAPLLYLQCIYLLNLNNWLESA